MLPPSLSQPSNIDPPCKCCARTHVSSGQCGSFNTLSPSDACSVSVFVPVQSSCRVPRLPCALSFHPSSPYCPCRPSCALGRALSPVKDSKPPNPSLAVIPCRETSRQINPHSNMCALAIAIATPAVWSLHVAAMPHAMPPLRDGPFDPLPPVTVLKSVQSASRPPHQSHRINHTPASQRTRRRGRGCEICPVGTALCQPGCSTELGTGKLAQVGTGGQ